MGMITSVVCLFCGLMAAFLFPIVLLVETVSPDVARPAFAFRLPTLEWRSAPANLPLSTHARFSRRYVGWLGSIANSNRCGVRLPESFAAVLYVRYG